MSVSLTQKASLFQIDTRDKFLAAFDKQGRRPPETPRWLCALFGWLMGATTCMSPGIICFVVAPEAGPEAKTVGGLLALTGFLLGGGYGARYMVRAQLPAPSAGSGGDATRHGRLLADYEPSYERGLAAKQGERVTISRSDGEWRRVRNAAGDEGWIPASFLQVELDEPVAAPMRREGDGLGEGLVAGDGGAAA